MGVDDEISQGLKIRIQDNENDKTAVDAVSGVYQGGLDNLKKMVEAQ